MRGTRVVLGACRLIPARFLRAALIVALVGAAWLPARRTAFGQSNAGPVKRPGQTAPVGGAKADQDLLSAPFDKDQAAAGQTRWAARLGVNVVETNSLDMKLVLIPPGEFGMGSTESDIAKADKILSSRNWLAKLQRDAEMPQHRVRITLPFYLGQTEVTKGQFARFIEATGTKTDAESDGRGGYGHGENFYDSRPYFNWRNIGDKDYEDEHPVVNVSWNDAVKFCEWLSDKENREYRLPTEAEWEYACRAGSQTLYQHGDDRDGLWAFCHNSEQNLISRRSRISPTLHVGQLKPNAWGLYDMHGNVAEWCADFYDANYYRNSPVEDPTGPAKGHNRVNRGNGIYDFRSAHRWDNPPGRRTNGFGFRIVRVAIHRSK